MRRHSHLIAAAFALAAASMSTPAATMAAPPRRKVEPDANAPPIYRDGKRTAQWKQERRGQK